MKEINRERFEAWLFSQPAELEFNFESTTQCAMCAFLNSQTSHGISSGSYYSNIWSGSQPYSGKDRIKIIWPDWLRKMALGGIKPLTVANMQRRYLELFPETEVEILTAPQLDSSPKKVGR